MALPAAAGLITLTVLAAHASVTAASLWGYIGAAAAHGIIYAVAVWLVLRQPEAADRLWLLLGAALLWRLVAVAAPITLTTDILRYVWDGRIQWAGFNPYLHVPAAPELAHLRDAIIYPDINQKETAVTIYPPTAELLFMLGVAIVDGTTGMKIVMAVADLAIIALVMAWLRYDRRPRAHVLIYAWHPLPIWEFTSQAHIDAAATALLIAAILAAVHRRQGLAGSLLAFAALTKYFPLALASALWRRLDWRMPVAFAATAALLYLPYWWYAGSGVLGFLSRHLDNEGYRDGYGFHVIWILRDFAIANIPGRAYVAVALAVLALMALNALLRRERDEIVPARMVAIAAAFVWLTSPHYAWYFGWLVPLLARWPSPAVIGFSLMACLQYTPGDEAGLFKASYLYMIVFGSLPLLLAIEALWRRRLAHQPRSPAGNPRP
jgi:hypothetical protein